MHTSEVNWQSQIAKRRLLRIEGSFGLDRSLDELLRSALDFNVNYGWTSLRGRLCDAYDYIRDKSRDDVKAATETVLYRPGVYV